MLPLEEQLHISELHLSDAIERLEKKVDKLETRSKVLLSTMSEILTLLKVQNDQGKLMYEYLKNCIEQSRSR